MEWSFYFFFIIDSLMEEIKEPFLFSFLLGNEDRHEKVRFEIFREVSSSSNDFERKSGKGGNAK
jgi:hypothetical protein